MVKIFIASALALVLFMQIDTIHAQNVTGMPQALAPVDTNNPDKDKPIEITADGTLEWKRAEEIFIARENALAQQGDVSIAAATLTANYREGEGGGMAIWRVTADENVVISSRENTAHGDRGVYNIDEGLAVMTGDDLKMVAPDQTVTAKDSFEYWVAQGRIKAIGDARVVRLEDTLEADEVSAVLKENNKGERVLDTLEATGNVVITTPTEVARGTYAIYKADTNIVTLTGGVTIMRGPNILEGAKAEVNLDTNTSRIFGGQATRPGTGKVRGVFYPNSQ